MSNQDYQTKYITSQQVQPIQLYYNFVLPSIPQQTFPQPMLIQSNPINSCYGNPSQIQSVITMPIQGMTQIQYQKQQLQQQQPQQNLQNFSSLDKHQQKIILVSELFQISQEEAIELLQENTCIYCRNELTEKNRYENMHDQITVKEINSSKQNSQEKSQSKYQKQFCQQQFVSIQQQRNPIELYGKKERTHNIQNNHINANCVHINNIHNNRDTNNSNQNEQTFNSISSQRDLLQQSTDITLISQQQQKSIDSRGNNSILDKKIKFDLSKNYDQKNNQTILYSDDVILNKVTNQQSQSKRIKNFQSVISQTNETNDEVYSDQKQMLSENNSNLEEDYNKQYVQCQIIRKGISKQSKNLIQTKKHSISENSQQQQNILNKSRQISEVFESPQKQQTEFTKNQINKVSIVYPSIQIQQNQHNNTKDIYQNAYYQEENNSDEQTEQKKDFQNDSNYTKNLLKGFRRVMIKNYGKNAEFIEDFKNYFDTFSLNNEFILKLFSDSSYNVYFEEFLQTDPSWWMKEARIKDTDNQIEFFEICKRREFSSIRTKRKNFIRPKLV